MAELRPAGLSAQARPRRRLLLEGGGDVTRRRPGFGSNGGGVSAQACLDDCGGDSLGPAAVGRARLPWAVTA